MRLVIAGDFPPDTRRLVGGIQAVIYHTLQGLLAYPELEIHVVSCEKGAAGATVKTPAGKTPRVSETPGVSCGDGDETPRWQAHHLASPPQLPHTLSMLTVDRRRVAHCVRALRPDVVHAHGQAAAYPWAAFDSGAPTVVTVHGINRLEAAIDRRGGAGVGWLRQLIWGQIEAACLRRAQDIVVISPFVARVIQPYTQARLHPIENPVDPRLLEMPRRPADPPRILYVGSIQKRKGLLDLIHALARLTPAVDENEPPVARPVLRVAGAFMEPYAAYGDQVRQAVAGYRLEPYVHFLGHLDREALLAEYAACTLFCLPSHLEASPVVVAEAMAAGCPVITTTIPSTEHLIHDGQTGLRVTPGDVTQLAHAISALLQQPARRHALGQAGRQVAQQRFSPQQAAAATYALYHCLMRGIHESHE